MNKKAFIFTLDAFFGSLLLISSLIFLSEITVQKPVNENMQFISRDILETLSKVTVNDLKETYPFLQEEINNGTIPSPNNSILVQIGEYWARDTADSTAKAKYLSEMIIKDLVPLGMGFNLTVGGDTLFYIPKDNFQSRVNTRRMISGIEKGKPLEGSTSDAFLKSIRDKPSSVYLYFGGFVGQGNVTGRMFVPPVDNVTEIIMELDLAHEFSLYINGDVCLNNSGGTMFVPYNANQTSDYWDISNCNASIITTGTYNNFTFVWDDVDDAYIGGGYVRLSYKTDEFQEIDYGTNIARLYLPGIKGIVNLFDSFFIPGELHNLTLYLHYLADHTNSNYTFYATIGNTSVYWDNESTSEVYINLSDDNFTALNYSMFNSTTVPLRIGFENVSFQEIITGGEGFGDIVLITDVSGSMGWEFDSTNNGVDRACNDTLLYDNSTQRISVAKCVDKIFVRDVLENTTLNRVGLVGYAGLNWLTGIPEIWVYNLSHDSPELEVEIDGYGANGGTGIPFAIANAFRLLQNPPPARLHKKDTWKFNLDYQFISLPSGWQIPSYDDSSWLQGETPFGYNLGETTTIGNFFDANLWENEGDVAGAPADFTSGILNSSDGNYGNNFGNRFSDDGWDYSENVYGTSDGSMFYNSPSIIETYNLDNKLSIYLSTGWVWGMPSASGAYGIELNITQEMYDIITTGGYGVFSFEYVWIPQGGNWFDSNDQVWIKSRITNTSGDTIYLGSNLDSTHSGGDGTVEVATTDNPSNSLEGYFSNDITSFITAPGMYYVDFGGKAYRWGVARNRGTFYFDNIRLAVTNKTGNSYYRNTFVMNDLSRFSNATLYVSSDDGTEVYLNGNLLVNDTDAPHTNSYWNINQNVDMVNFTEGDNVIAVKLSNNDSVSGWFDLELRADMTGRAKAIVIMSDGDANVCAQNWTDSLSGSCSACSGRSCAPNESSIFDGANVPDHPLLSALASEQTLNLSCHLFNYYNISIYSVAFGDVSAEGRLTLNLSAACDNESHFYDYKNTTGISKIYEDIADSILSGFSSRQSQTIIVSGGDFEESTLYPDSYVEFNYTPFIETPQTNEISLTFESENFNSCNGTVNIPQGVRVIDAKVVSYSGNFWTDYLGVNGVEVFNLSDYNNESYVALGDPFVLQVPPSLLVVGGENNFTLKTGDNPYINTNCSLNNSFQYVGMVNVSTGRTPLLPKTGGCNWTIESEDYVNVSILVPEDYVGTAQCNYTNVTFNLGQYDDESTSDVAVFNLLRGLDFDNDGRTIVNLEQKGLEINIISVTGLPYQWGPSVIEAQIWQ